MRTIDGLFDVIAVGCVLEFTTALSRSRYDPSYDPGTDEARALRAQENQAREWFRVVMKVFGSQHLILSGRAMVEVSTIWESVMVRFAIAVVNHMKHRSHEKPTAPGVNPHTVEDALRMHLRDDHPDLIPAFEVGLQEQGMNHLSWPMSDHPLDEVIPKRPLAHHLLHALGLPEARELPGLRLSLNSAQGSTGVRNAVRRFYRGAWPGDESPHD